MDTFVKVISQQGMWGAVLATLTFVTIGFFVTKTGMFTKEINGKISKFVLAYAMPFLCIGAFMQNADKDNAKEVGIVLGLSLVFYIFAAVFSTILIKFYPKMVSSRVNKKALEMWERSDKTESQEKFKDAYLNSFRQKIMTSQMMLSYGSLQFFAYPLVIAMAGNDSNSIFGGFSLALAQTWCIPYMIGAFSYVKMSYAGEKLTRSQIKPVLKSLFSPMMVCLYISLIIWALQFIPGLDKWFKPDPDGQKPYGLVYDLKAKGTNQFWGGFKANLPVFDKIIGAGIGIISPLAWIIIGGSLAGSNIKAAMKDSSVWVTTIRKLVILPLFIFLITLLFVYPFNGKSGLLTPSTGTLLVLLAATPPAAVTMIFSVAYKHEHSGFTAQVSSLSTLLCLIAMPIWILISNVTFKLLAA